MSADDFRTVPVPGGDAPDTDDTDDTAVDDAPAGAPRTPFSAEPKERTRELKRLEDQLTDVYASIGVWGGMAGQFGHLTGQVVARNSTNLAASWVDLAEKNPGVRRALQNFVQAGGWAGVIGAHVAVALPIAAMAGVLPRDMAQRVFMGLAVMDPELYEYLRGQTQPEPSQNGDVHG